MEIDLKTALFLCPLFFHNDPCGPNGLPVPLEKPDLELHFTQTAAELTTTGSKLFCLDGIPKELQPAKVSSSDIIRFRKITSPDGKDYIPLFLHFQAMTALFGNNIHIGVVTLADAKQLCSSEPGLAGVVLSPGKINQIIPRESLLE